MTASLLMVTDASEAPSHGGAVDDFVEDFRRRVSAWAWWTDALFVHCSSPKGDGAYRSDPRVFLVGPASEQPPAYAWRSETVRGRLWVSVLLPDAVDLLLEAKAVATRPAASEQAIQNFFVVHLARDSEQDVQVGYRWVHHPDVNAPGGCARVDDLSWLCVAVAELKLPTPAIL